MTHLSMDGRWIHVLKDLVYRGARVSPRGRPTYELEHRTITVNMRAPVLLNPSRKLSYRFMAAEAYWILSGSNKVSGIAPWNKHISEFSDDGVVFAGAYGPPIAEQLPYVVDALIKDGDTRQAGLTIWNRSPRPSKDIPCTIALFFSVRSKKMNCHAFMRSSDAWLGLPYDVFNFSMLSHLVCSEVNARQRDGEPVAPGTLYLTAASQHLYDDDMVRALACCDTGAPDQEVTPSTMYMSAQSLMDTLVELRDSKPGDAVRWWES